MLPSNSHHRAQRLSLSVLLAASTPSLLRAASTTYIGPDYGNWSNPANWTSGAPLDPSFDASFPSNTWIARTFLDVSPTLHSLALSSPYGNGHISIIGTGSLTASSFLFSGYGSLSLSAPAFTATGNSSWSGNVVPILDPSSTFTNAGTLTINTLTSTYAAGWSGGTFLNQGSIIKNSSDPTDLVSTFINTGSLQINAGELRLNNQTSSHAGPISTAANATLSFWQPASFLANASLTYGNYRFESPAPSSFAANAAYANHNGALASNASLTFLPGSLLNATGSSFALTGSSVPYNSYSPTLTLSSGSPAALSSLTLSLAFLAGSDTLALDSLLALSNATLQGSGTITTPTLTLAGATLTGSRTLLVSKAINWNGTSSIALSPSSLLSSSGTFTLATSGSPSFSGGTLVNTGLLLKPTSDFNSLSSTLSNIGTLTVARGTLALSSIQQLSGTTLTAGVWNAAPYVSPASVPGGVLLLPSPITTIGPAASVLLSGSSASFPALHSLASIQGAFTLGTKQSFASADLLNDGLLAINASSTLTLSGALSGSGTTTLAGTATVGALTQTSLLLDSGANLTLLPQAPSANTLSTLTLSGKPGNWAARLNLTTNALILAATPANKATTVSTLLNQITSARNNGTWDKNGITSSTVAANPSQLTVALFDNADLNLPSYAGQPLDANSILIVPTQIGDANLDHNVDLADYDLWYKHVGAAGSATSRGDFNLDNNIDLADYDAWYQHVGASFPLLSPQSSALSTSSIPVPEPTTLALLALALPILKRRRRH